MIVLDTHVLLWWTQQPELLSSAAVNAIDQAESILIPAICFWETSLLVRKDRLALKHGRSVAEWARQLLLIPRLRAVALTAELALAADTLSMHPDPADRFIVATALDQQAPLVTKDDLLRNIGWIDTVW